MNKQQYQDWLKLKDGPASIKVSTYDGGSTSHASTTEGMWSDKAETLGTHIKQEEK